MSAGNARQDKIRIVATRTTQRLALAAALVILGSEGLHTAVANGDTRTISLLHTHRSDEITVTFKRNGRYDADGLKKLNHFLRDWRTDDVTTMDPQLFDAVWEVQREFGPDKKIHIISSYRSPRTNAMLRARSNGVARHSLHMQGKAMDFFIPGVPLEQVRAAGLRLQRGGVGFYPTSGSPFVHMDVGSVRHWPRMTREQLARVFPDGRTVHVPADGKPLSGYALAQADIEKRATSPEASKPNALARMFSFSKPAIAKPESTVEAAKPAPAPVQVASAAPGGRENLFAGMNATPLPTPAPAAAAPTPAVAKVPTPKARPVAANVRLAAAPTPRPAPVAGTYSLASVTPNDIIQSRGYWQGLPDKIGHDLDSGRTVTASIGPFAAPPGYGEGKPRDGALAYARQAEPDVTNARVKPMGAGIPRSIAANTTVAAKAAPNRPSEVQSAAAEMPAPRNAEGLRWEGPWMRALIMTPSVEQFMSTTLYGTQDFRSLRPMLVKPTEMVVMAFTVETASMLNYQRFEGRAIEFLATATFSPRSTAALR